MSNNWRSWRRTSTVAFVGFRVRWPKAAGLASAGLYTIRSETRCCRSGGAGMLRGLPMDPSGYPYILGPDGKVHLHPSSTVVSEVSQAVPAELTPKRQVPRSTDVLLRCVPKTRP